MTITWVHVTPSGSHSRGGGSDALSGDAPGGPSFYLPGVIAHTLPEPRPFRELPQLDIDRYCCLGGGEADLMGRSSRFAESIVAAHRTDSHTTRRGRRRSGALLP